MEGLPSARHLSHSIPLLSRSRERVSVEGVIDAEGLEAKVLVSIKQVPSSHIPAHTYPSCPLSATGEFRGFCCTHFDSAHAECQSNDLLMTSQQPTHCTTVPLTTLSNISK